MSYEKKVGQKMVDDVFESKKPKPVQSDWSGGQGDWAGYDYGWGGHGGGGYTNGSPYPSYGVSPRGTGGDGRLSRRGVLGIQEAFRMNVGRDGGARCVVLPPDDRRLVAEEAAKLMWATLDSAGVHMSDEFISQVVTLVYEKAFEGMKVKMGTGLIEVQLEDGDEG
jgi:hypothetical protein